MYPTVLILLIVCMNCSSVCCCIIAEWRHGAAHSDGSQTEEDHKVIA